MELSTKHEEATAIQEGSSKQQDTNLTIAEFVVSDEPGIQPAAVVTNQPRGFNVSALDPPSQLLYQGLSGKHMSGEKLMANVEAAGNELLAKVEDRFVSLKSNMDYNDFLSGLTLENEVIVSGEPHLQYKSMTITDESGEVLDTKVGGRALLTDKRLLLLSSQYFQTSSLTEFKDPKKPPGGYTMEMSCKDATFYKPIPLANLKSVEIDGRVGVSGSISIHASDPPLRGLCGLCGCVKNWTSKPMVYSEFNETTLRCGLLMPPWQQKTFLTLYIQEIVPLAYLKEFTASIQILIHRIEQGLAQT
eukprot:gene12268-13533_t